MDYQHIFCDTCGGIIGMRDREKFACDRCGKQFDLHSLDCDRLMINDKTGWIFLVIDKEKKND